MTEIAVVLHVGSISPLAEILNYISNISKAGRYFDLFVNLTEEIVNIEDACDIINSKFPYAIIIASENRGMDIGGFMRFIPLLLRENYKYVLKLHTKTSNSWRRTLIDPICGSSDKVLKCLFHMEKKGSIMVGSSCHKYYESKNKYPNYYYLSRLTERFSLKNTSFWFIGGTMFWIDMRLIRSVFSTQNLRDLISEMNTPETLDPYWYIINYKDTGIKTTQEAIKHYNEFGVKQNRSRNCLEARLKKDICCTPDGMIEHAYERLFGLIVQNAGKTVTGV